MMGLGSVRPRCHDRLEGGLLGPEAPHLGVKGEGHLGLGRAFPEHRPHTRECRVRDGGGRGDPGYLAGVLALPEALDEIARRHQLDILGPTLGPSAESAPS